MDNTGFTPEEAEMTDRISVARSIEAISVLVGDDIKTFADFTTAIQATCNTLTSVCMTLSQGDAKGAINLLDEVMLPSIQRCMQVVRDNPQNIESSSVLSDPNGGFDIDVIVRKMQAKD